MNCNKESFPTTPFNHFTYPLRPRFPALNIFQIQPDSGRPMNDLIPSPNDHQLYVKHLEEASTILKLAPTTDLIADSALELLFNEVSCLSSHNSVPNELIYKEQQFRMRWQTVVRDLLNLANLFRSINDYTQIVRQYQLLLSLDVENRALWLALGHSYLLRGSYEESYKAYENMFFAGGKCQDIEAWYIIGALYDKVSSSLSHSWVCTRIA